MVKDTEKEIKKGEDKKQELEVGILSPFKARESRIEDELKAAEEKIKQLRENKKKAEDERKGIESELRKLPPVLAKGIKNIEEKQVELAKLQNELDTLKEGWQVEAKKSNIKEDFINKLLGKRSFGLKPVGEHKARVSPEEKQTAILKAVGEGNDNVTKLYQEVGMSQNTRDNIQALITAGKLKKDEGTGKFSVP